jgi:hypothetical protein
MDMFEIQLSKFLKRRNYVNWAQNPDRKPLKALD